VARLPDGTITFMLTDLQGSTRAWEGQPKAMRAAMARHDAILARTIKDHKGEQVEAGREGDSILAVFRTAANAADCALEIQENFASETWPDGLELQVRVALHTGEAQLREGHYFGTALNRCARLLTLCHPGQILLTKATESMLADELPTGSELRDLGSHRLKDLARPEQVFQLNDLARPLDFPGIRSGSLEQTSVPRYLTNFVGRTGELKALQSLLTNSRMVTLTGAGGSGKTRLAAELGQACLDLWPGGVWWVELEPITDSQQVPGAVVAALELPGRGPALDVITRFLSARRAVLILDNCEHLAAACARFCETALQRCPELTVVATSREGLGVPGEARWSVSSMAATEAAQLFEARAQLVVLDFKVTTSNLETVTQICHRLDGMPLAIELAAARLDMMSDKEILSQLADRFHLLTGGSRTAPERQQTMIATIDWSYRLLSEEEALLFRRSSVFRGGFTLESVQAVCADGVDASPLDMVAELVHKSMVVAEWADDEPARYRLLESQLDYASDLLRTSGETDLIRRRHYDYYRESLRARTWESVGLRQFIPGLADIEWKAREWSNLWAALGWARDNADDVGLGLASDLARSSWDMRPADLVRVSRVLADLLDLSRAEGLPRLLALQAAAGTANLLGDYKAAVQPAEACLALARELGDPEWLASALSTAGLVHARLGELDSAAQSYEEALSLLESSSNRRLADVIRMWVAELAAVRGDYVSARDILVECVASARRVGDLGVTAQGMEELAWAQLGLANHETAAAIWKESISIGRHLGDLGCTMDCVAGLSCVAGAGHDDERALRLAAAVERLTGEWAITPRPQVSTLLAASERIARSRLGTLKSEEAWNQGRAMTANQAIDYALNEGEPETRIDASPLSRRQREVATLVAAGLTNREIAERLFIAERSAEGHVERIRNKLGVRSRTEVAAWAVEHGLTAPRMKERGTRDGPLRTRREQPT
jgi:predicted ATPase/class 3 adenylate cyclase/DNA-binding CsgD family transcriptional regulator